MSETILTTTALEAIFDRMKVYQPNRATVFGKDGNQVDIRIGSSSTLIRGVEVAGGEVSLNIGDEVLVLWQEAPGKQGPTPIALPLSGSVKSTVTYSNVSEKLDLTLAVDEEQVIINSDGEIAIKKGSLGIEHLAFVPSLVGHTHKDSLTRNGWQVTTDGHLFTEDTFIASDGRIWVGNVNPASAPFYVEADGTIHATAGYIAGWDIVSDTLSKNDVTLDPAGRITVGSGNDVIVLDSQDTDYRVWVGNASASSAPFKIEKDGSLFVGTSAADMSVLSTSDATYRFWIGNENPALADFRVSKTGEVWLDNAHVDLDLESSNYVSGSTGWKLDSTTGSAEFQDVIIRGEISQVVFVQEATAIFTGRSRINDGDVLIADLDPSDTTIDVRGGQLEANDICQISTEGGEEWIQIGTKSTITGGYRYNVVRDLADAWDPAAGGSFLAGDGISVTGRSTYGGAGTPQPAAMFGEVEFAEGEPFAGYSYQNSGGMLTIDGTRQWGPYFGVVRRFGPEYNQLTDVARFGRLDGFLGETREIYGIAIGSSTQHFTYSAEDGLEIATRSGSTSINDDGLTTDAFTLEAISTAPSYSDGYLGIYIDSDDHKLYGVYKDGASERTVLIQSFDGTPAWGTGTVDTSGTPEANDYARFTDEDTVEGRSYSEVKTDLGLVIGTNVLAYQDIGIADDNLLEVDAAAGAPVSGEYARFTANGLEGRTETEFKQDYSLEIGVDVLAYQAIGISDNNLLEVDGTVATNDIMQATANGLKGLTYAELVPLLDGAADWDFADHDLHNMKQVDFQDEHVSSTGTSSTHTVVWTEGNNQKVTLGANTTFSFTAPDGTCHMQLKIVQGASAYTATWTGDSLDINWPGGTAPTISTGSGDIDILSFYYDGTAWWGAYLQDFS